MKFQSAIYERFEDRLDVQSIVNTQINLLALVKILLTQRQMLLFRHQDGKTLKKFQKKIKKKKMKKNQDSGSASASENDDEGLGASSSDEAELQPVTAQKRTRILSNLHKYKIES